MITFLYFHSKPSFFSIFLLLFFSSGFIYCDTHYKTFFKHPALCGSGVRCDYKHFCRKLISRDNNFFLPLVPLSIFFLFHLLVNAKCVFFLFLSECNNNNNTLNGLVWFFGGNFPRTLTVNFHTSSDFHLPSKFHSTLRSQLIAFICSIGNYNQLQFRFLLNLHLLLLLVFSFFDFFFAGKIHTREARRM